MCCSASRLIIFMSLRRMGRATSPRASPDYTDDPEVDTRRRQAWEEFRDELLPAWIAEHPGSRPHAWWLYDAPERRRCVTGPHPHDAKDWPEDCPKRLWYGKPSTWQANGYDYTAKYESQVDYLEPPRAVDAGGAGADADHVTP